MLQPAVHQYRCQYQAKTIELGHKPVAADWPEPKAESETGKENIFTRKFYFLKFIPRGIT